MLMKFKCAELCFLFPALLYWEFSFTCKHLSTFPSFLWVILQYSPSSNWCGRFQWTLIEAESRSSADRSVDRLVTGHSPSAAVWNVGHLCSPPPGSCSSSEQSARKPFQRGTGFQSATWVLSKQHRPDACLFKVWNDPSRSAGLDWHCLLICCGLLRITRLLANSRLSAKQRQSPVRKNSRAGRQDRRSAGARSPEWLQETFTR